MRMLKKGGVTPCDRRLDRRKVAIAAAAALFLFAAEVRANIVDFVIVQPVSTLQQSNIIFGPAIGINGTVPVAPGSDTTTMFGHIWVDITPTTIQLMPGSYISLATTGVYPPHDPVISDPVGPPPVGADPGNFGLAIPGLGLFANQYNLRLDNGNVYLPSSPMGLAGVNFNLAGQGMQFVDGRQAFVSGLGNDTGDLVGFPVIFFGSNAADVGTWDGTTLTIPIHSTLTFNVTTDFGGIDETVIMTGAIVAVPYVPEPSTMTILGFGVVGLLSYAWRARKRRALVA